MEILILSIVTINFIFNRIELSIVHKNQKFILDKIKELKTKQKE